MTTIKGAMTLIAVCCASTTAAQTFPSKPLRIIVPFAPGGASDITSRALAEYMSKGLGQPVLIENRPGAGAVIGYEAGAKAAPDGHTLTNVFPSFIINPSVRRVGYDPFRDYRPVTQTISLPMTFAVHNSVPVKSLKELIAMARAKPAEITYGTPGVGTTHHVLTELFALTTNVKLTHVPFSGGAPAITALAGGHIALDVGNVSEIAPFATSGKVRALVVTTAKRAEQLPDVPTFREVGLAELEATNWAGLVAPAATPAAVIARLNAEIVRALRNPDVQEKFKVQGMTALPSTPEQFGALLQSESARYGKVVRAVGIKAE